MRHPASCCCRLLLLCLLLTPVTCFAWSAKLVTVIDGDTLIVLRDGQQQEIRLYGIDCPEKDQNYGQQATALTTALVAGRNIEIEPKDVDHYGRVVGLVKVDSLLLNALIVENGYAWVYRQYCKEKFCSAWIKSEKTARTQRKGIWATANNTPPWEWRNQQRAAKAEAETEQVILIGADKPTSGGSSRNSSRCDGRIYCSQMTSCQEAKFFLRNCPGTKMDGNNDGVPCEKQWCR